MGKISLVVPTYGRMKNIVKLINSLQNSNIDTTNYEIVIVSSDDINSEKIKWINSLKDIDINLILDDKREHQRVKSLYYFENIGIKASKHDWVMVCNDDMWVESDWYESFLQCVNEQNKVYLISSHIGQKGLGFRIPEIGHVTKDGVEEPLWLFDMSIIHKSIYNNIGYLDEAIGWYGKGADLSLAITFLTEEKPILCHDVKIHHDLETEHRQTNIIGVDNTHPGQHDFGYIRDKWDKWIIDNNKNYTHKW